MGESRRSTDICGSSLDGQEKGQSGVAERRRASGRGELLCWTGGGLQAEMRVGWDSSNTVMRENCCDTTRHGAARATLRGDAGKCQRATGGERGEVAALVEDVFSGGCPERFSSNLPFAFALGPFVDVVGTADSRCHVSHGQMEGGFSIHLVWKQVLNIFNCQSPCLCAC